MPEYEALSHSAQPRGDKRQPHQQFTLTPLEAMQFITCTSGTNSRLAFSLVRIAQCYTLTCLNDETVAAFQLIRGMHT